MAWITPYTSWLETDRCTYEDMNRIAGNVNELCETSLKDDYTQDDVVTLTEWRAIISALTALATAVKYTSGETMNESATADSFNAVEGFTLGLKEWIDLLIAQESANIYAGDGVHLGDGQYLR